MTLKKSLEMPHFFKSAETDFKNLDLLQYKTMCDWLRQIHTQNTRIINLLKVSNTRAITEYQEEDASD